MSKIQDATALIASTAKIDADAIVSEITNWNKTKFYPVSLIDIRIDKNGVTDNSEFIGEIVDKIEEAVKETVDNELDLENVSSMKKTVAEIGKWIVETRKLQTNPLKDIAAKYIQHENKFSVFNTDLTKKIDAINEKEYQKAEGKIREYFEELLQNVEVEYNFQIFDSFIAAKRKTKVLTDKGELNKKIRDEIAEQIRLAIEPLLKAKELEAKKNLQLKQFTNNLEKIKIDGDNEQIEQAIDELTRATAQIEELYPDIVEFCKMSIENKIASAKTNITANKMVADRQANDNIDKKLMDEFLKLEKEAKTTTLNPIRLVYIKMRLREMYHEAKLEDNKQKIKELGVSVALRLDEIERQEIEATIASAPKEKISANTKIFCASIEDIEVISGMEIEAESEEEAKKELCRRFETHLEMIDLIVKGE